MRGRLERAGRTPLHSVELTRASRVLLLARTVDHPHVVQNLLEVGVSGITSNSLEVLLGLARA